MRETALLKEGLQKLSLDGGERNLSLLIRYIEEIELFNPAYGLVKINGREELITKHILDSLAPIGIIRGLTDKTADGRRIADAGSGAGLPGIPLAVCMPGAEFTLIERRGRRAGFLRNTLAVLGLSNVRVEETEMENLARNPRASGSFNLVVSRAFRPLGLPLLKSLFTLLASGGALAAYKGRRASIEEELDKVSGLKNLSHEIIPLDVPFLDEERHLLVMRNIARR